VAVPGPPPPPQQQQQQLTAGFSTLEFAQTRCAGEPVLRHLNEAPGSLGGICDANRRPRVELPEPVSVVVVLVVGGVAYRREQRKTSSSLRNFSTSGELSHLWTFSTFFCVSEEFPQIVDISRYQHVASAFRIGRRETRFRRRLLIPSVRLRSSTFCHVSCLAGDVPAHRALS